MKYLWQQNFMAVTTFFCYAFVCKLRPTKKSILLFADANKVGGKEARGEKKRQFPYSRKQQQNTKSQIFF
jgi:hypothetical protein